MLEEWKDIENFEGLYQISNFGNIRSLSRNSFIGKLLNPTTRLDGYLYVQLSKNGKIKIGRIHRLVANAFIAKIPNKNSINHKDANKSNNNVLNLEWCNHKENNDHARKLGILVNDKGEQCHNSKLKNQDILDIRAKLDSISDKELLIDMKHYLARKYNTKVQNIHSIYKRKAWKHLK